MLPQELLLTAGLQPRLTQWQNQHCQWLLPEAECAKVLWPQYRFVCLVSCVSSTSPKYKGAFHMGAEGRFNSSSSSWCQYGRLSSL